MSRAVSHRNRPLWPSYIALLLFILILTSTTLQRVAASPIPFQQDLETSTSESWTTANLTDILKDSSINGSMVSSMESSMESSMGSLMNSSMDSSMDNSMDSSTDNSTEITPNTDVYVIKAVVYEIGILTDADNTTSSESTERQESVDISLYSAPQADEFS
ncbi:PREDICTED: papilin-like [Vollenhovia emeryi]|uniref:papilin-like n=1 Tax=Vollenhovia emeryi TaxID=411798 RepID=UPI0005F512CB|nr:PREDICTED: papilin-like [Vollenhovia emeryi]